jgi:hypothetical protein
MSVSKWIEAIGATLCLVSYVVGRLRGSAPGQKGSASLLPGLLKKAGVPMGVVLMSAGLMMQVLSPVRLLPGAEAPKYQGEAGMTITLIGTVTINEYWPVFTPDDGQSVNVPLPLMMTNFPQNGSTQDHINAAIAYFTGKTGRYSLTGAVRPLQPTQIFSVDRADRQ